MKKARAIWSGPFYEFAGIIEAYGTLFRQVTALQGRLVDVGPANMTSRAAEHR